MSTEAALAGLFRMLGQPVRVQILLVIADQEACVCHLQAVLKIRQASISQHLMALRKAGLVATHRNGRHIFYRLTRFEVIGVLEQTAQLTGIEPAALKTLKARPIPGCPCPQCNPDMDPKLICKKM